MGHGHALRNDLIIRDIHDHTRGALVLSPAMRGVGAREGSHVLRDSTNHRQTIEVTTVLGRQGGNPRWDPAGIEGVRHIHCAQTREASVNEPQLAILVVFHFVDGDVTGERNVFWHIHRVVQPRGA